MISYHCQNCDHRFHLAEDNEVRCPQCFWTSSVERVGAEEEPPKVLKQENNRQPAPISNRKFPKALFFILPGVIAVLAAGWLAYPLMKRFVLQGKQTIKAAMAEKSESVKAPKQRAEFPTAVSTADVFGLLTQEERNILFSQLSFPIPRELTEDELEILNPRVNFSLPTDEIPKLKFWLKADFENYLTSQQTRRGIFFSRSYERELIRLFEEHHAKAAVAFEQKRYEETRTELLTALIFPVYQNNIQLHRSVAMVMMQGYINDVLGKIRALNSVLAVQGLAQTLGQVKMDYDRFMAMTAKKEWEPALQALENLEQEVRAADEKSKQIQVTYPPIASQIDADIRKGLERQDETIEPISTSLNSVLADLKIKKKVLKENLPTALEEKKEQYLLAVSAIEKHRWEEADGALQLIDFPSDIAADAKQKQAIVEKILSGTKKHTP